jgi:hypothetical protein
LQEPLNVCLAMQSVHITTKVVSSYATHGKVYSIQHYVIKFVSEARQVGGFLRVLQFPPPIHTLFAFQCFLYPFCNQYTIPKAFYKLIDTWTNFVDLYNMSCLRFYVLIHVVCWTRLEYDRNDIINFRYKKCIPVYLY